MSIDPDHMERMERQRAGRPREAAVSKPLPTFDFETTHMGQPIKTTITLRPGSAATAPDGTLVWLHPDGTWSTTRPVTKRPRS